MFEIKSEIELYTGKKIDIGQQLLQVQKEAKARGQDIKDAHIKQIKKWFTKADKKHKHRAFWLAHCTELDIPYSQLEADCNFDLNYSMKNGEYNNGKDIEVPITVTVGVTLSLAGLFLMFVPIPVSQTIGWYTMDTGIGILSSYALGKWEEYNTNSSK